MINIKYDEHKKGGICMPSFRNYKICDNSPECSGIEVCPVKAITFNEKHNLLK